MLKIGKLPFVLMRVIPDAAVMLSINFAILQSHVAEPSLHTEAIEEIERALRVLFLCSQFPDLCYLMFRKFVAGSLSIEEQELLKKLGAKL